VVHARVCVSLTHSMTGMRKARVRGPCVVTGRLTGSTPVMSVTALRPWRFLVSLRGPWAASRPIASRQR
jgi:hypothetical protein